MQIFSNKILYFADTIDHFKMQKINLLAEKINIPIPGVRLRFAFLVFVFTTFILLVFQPFGTQNYTAANKYGKLLGYGIICFAIFAIVPSFIIKKIFTKDEATAGNWNIREEFFVILVAIFLSSLVCSFYNYFLISVNASLTSLLWQFQIWGLLILFFPVAGYLYFLHTSSVKIENSKLNQQQEETLTITGAGKTDIITLMRKEVCFFKASDNYVEIYLVKKEAGLQKRLIRGGLSSIYEQVKEAGFFQVHRSYIVNVLQRPLLNLSNGNYELEFKNCDAKAPVSRAYLKELRKKISEIPV